MGTQSKNADASSRPLASLLSKAKWASVTTKYFMKAELLPTEPSKTGAGAYWIAELGIT